jgi:7-cyano-7-deazaguanine synthase in queuosine biosynthesis
MFEGIQIKIKNNEHGKLEGRVIQGNDNKYIKLFVDSNDTWVKEINRTSNYQFTIVEQKIAAPLFALYGQETAKEYKAEFINDTTIGLGSANQEPSKSKVVYKKIAQ